MRPTEFISNLFTTLLQKQPVVHFRDAAGERTQVPIIKGRSLLDSLLDAGVSVPHSCRSGLCHSCALYCSNGALPSASQKGIKDAEKAQGKFLSCLCMPDTSLSVHLSTPLPSTRTATLDSVEHLASGVSILKMRVTDFAFTAGQFCNLTNAYGVTRSYSIASRPGDEHLEFHVRHVEQGHFSQWVRSQLKAGDALSIQGPMGNCCYTFSAHKDRPLLLAGVGTGLAPLYSIVCDALYSGHLAPITLVLGAKKTSQLYYTQALVALTKKFSQFNVHFCVQDDDESGTENLVEADLYQWVKTSYPELAQYTVFLCGAQSFTRKMQRQCFLAGASMNDIFHDSFIPATP